MVRVNVLSGIVQCDYNNFKRYILLRCTKFQEWKCKHTLKMFSSAFNKPFWSMAGTKGEGVLIYWADKILSKLKQGLSFWVRHKKTCARGFLNTSRLESKRNITALSRLIWKCGGKSNQKISKYPGSYFVYKNKHTFFKGTSLGSMRIEVRFPTSNSTPKSCQIRYLISWVKQQPKTGVLAWCTDLHLCPNAENQTKSLKLT